MTQRGLARTGTTFRPAARSCYHSAVQTPGPVLTTERLVLLPATDVDIAELVRHFSEEQTLRYLGSTHPNTYERVNAIAAASNSDFRRAGYGIWAIRLRPSGAVVGVAGLRAIERGERQRGAATREDVEFLVLLRPRHWKAGYALEAARAVLYYALVDLGLPRVVARPETTNDVAVALLRRVGMTPVETGQLGPMNQFQVTAETLRPQQMASL